VAAQDADRPLSEVIPELYVGAIVNEYLAFVTELPGFLDEEALFKEFTERVGFVVHVVKLAGNQLTSFPLASASGGFTWNFDTGSGAFTRTSNSFGPIFAERPLTIGRKRLNAGANYQRVTFDHL
jgi:hypothetical protein